MTFGYQIIMHTPDTVLGAGFSRTGEFEAVSLAAAKVTLRDMADDVNAADDAYFATSAFLDEEDGTEHEVRVAVIA